MESAIAATKNLFFQTGRRSKLSFSESEFIALNISTVTRIESEIVVAVFAISLVNIWHPISGNLAEHWWKCVCVRKRLSVQAHKRPHRTYELVEADLRAAGVEEEPPSVTRHGCDADICADYKIAEEQPAAHERLG
jgi:hypothetical protein